MRKALALFFTSALVTITLIACSGSRGDSCDDEGKVGGQCHDGLVCGNTKEDGSGKLECLTSCVTDVNCETGTVCGAINRTDLKGCRPPN